MHLRYPKSMNSKYNFTIDLRVIFYYTKIRPFQGPLAPLNAQIAQSVEQGTENPRVAGSIPALGTKKATMTA